MTPEPPGLEKPTAVAVVPTDDQIAVFLHNQKKAKANKRREQMSSLFSKALPK